MIKTANDLFQIIEFSRKYKWMSVYTAIDTIKNQGVSFVYFDYEKLQSNIDFDKIVELFTKYEKLSKINRSIPKAGLHLLGKQIEFYNFR